MDDSVAKLTKAVAAAIDYQLQTQGGPVASDPARSHRDTAEALVREALTRGGIGTAHVAEFQPFAEGNSSMLVARMRSDVSFVVKVDRSPAIVTEAHLLRRAGSDLSLPAATRAAFPRVYAIDEDGPIYGYLMEDLGDFTTLSRTTLAQDVAATGRVVEAVWDAVLEPAYRATRSVRVIPNVAEDYFGRVRSRLDAAVERGLFPAGGRPIVVDAGDLPIRLADGWSAMLDRATTALLDVRPPFSTFVHGDPNPENILWREGPDGALEFRLIDPKTWWTGDYVFDAAKIAHYLKVTAPVEQQRITATLTSEPGDESVIAYTRKALVERDGVDASLVARLATFAEDPAVADSPGWRARYALALAANWLGIVGPRLLKGDRDLALISFGEGARLLTAADAG